MSDRYAHLHTRAMAAARDAVDDALKMASDSDLQEIADMARYEECPDIVCSVAAQKLHVRQQRRAQGKLTKRGRV